MLPVESLFRNGSNKNVDQETTVLRLRIQEFRGENPLSELGPSEIKAFDRYYKFIFNRDKRERFELLQMEYTDSKTKHSSVTRLYENKSLLKYFVKKKNVDSEKDIFWGVVTSLVLNRSDIISAFLKKTNEDYRENRAVINRERKTLYDSYKRYLQTIRDEPELKGKFVSPLNPIERGEKKKVKKLLQRPFYMPSQKISLVKEGGEFYVLVKLEKVRAKFTNNDF